jgi:hypothetical protein
VYIPFLSTSRINNCGRPCYKHRKISNSTHYLLGIYQITRRHIKKNATTTAMRTSSLDFQKGYDRSVQIMGNRSPGRTNFIGAELNARCGSSSVAIDSRHRSDAWNFEPQPGFLKNSCTPRYVSNRSDASTANQRKTFHFFRYQPQCVRHNSLLEITFVFFDTERICQCLRPHNVK